MSDETKSKFTEELFALLDKHNATFAGSIHDELIFHLGGLEKPLAPVPSAEPLEDWVRKRLTGNHDIETTMTMFQRKLKERDERRLRILLAAGDALADVSTERRRLIWREAKESLAKTG
jgi:hypothetical protein